MKSVILFRSEAKRFESCNGFPAEEIQRFSKSIEAFRLKSEGFFRFGMEIGSHIMNDFDCYRYGREISLSPLNKPREVSKIEEPSDVKI